MEAALEGTQYTIEPNSDLDATRLQLETALIKLNGGPFSGVWG